MTTHTASAGAIPARFDDARLYEGVRTRRIFAFCVDYLIVGLLMIPVAVVVFLFGLLTLGLGWALFGILFPLVALTYVGSTMGGRHQATIGMRMMSIRLERLDATRVDFLLAAAHTVFFWAANVILTPFVLVVALLANRKRTLHDILLGTVVTRSDR